LVGWYAVFAGKPAPTGAENICKKLVGWQAAIIGTPPGPSSLPQKSKGIAADTTASLFTTQQAER
jgi:hypothetical protein